MTSTARLAYGNARVHARKSRLIAPAILVALATAERPDRTIEGWRDLESDADAVSLAQLAFGRLADDYAALIRAYPSGAAVLSALARLQELENVKLAWRAVTYRAQPAQWHSLWRPMGLMETLSLSRCASAASFDQLVAAMSGTRFGDVSAGVLRAHPGDLAAAELAFDRWGSHVVVAAARALSRREDVARCLVYTVVYERDVAVIERARGSLAASPHVAMRMASVLGELLDASSVRVLSQWVGEGGAPLTLPRQLSPRRRSVNTFAALRRAIRVARRTACRRAFRGQPFSLAPAVALVLLREDEARALVSIGELRARHASTADVVRVIDVEG
jgi:vacuolar-type H+-ATPase subunit C/Vma6